MKLISIIFTTSALFDASVSAQDDDITDMKSAMNEKVSNWKNKGPSPYETRQRGKELKDLIRDHGELACDPATGLAGGKFECENMDLLAFLTGEDLGSDYAVEKSTYTSDLIGWKDSRGHQFALVGCWDGTSIVDVSVPTNPRVLGFVPSTPGTICDLGSSQMWRDIKVFGNIAYIGADNLIGHGIQVFDLERTKTMPRGNNSIVPKVDPDFIAYEADMVHNLVIAKEANKILAVGIGPHDAICEWASFKLFDISGKNALAPTFEKCVYLRQGYVHDGQCILYQGPDMRYQGHTVCAFFTAYVRPREFILYDLDTMQEINSFSYASARLVHQGQFSADHRFLYVGDERDEVREMTAGYPRTYIWDLSDLESSTSYLGYFDIPSRHPAVDHNSVLKGDLIFKAAYSAGARILKLVDGGANLTEVAYFDMENTCECVDVRVSCECNPFVGTWTHHPMTGFTLANSMFEGLFILRPTFN